MINRRDFLKLAGVAALVPRACAPVVNRQRGVWVNDVHSRLNPTHVLGEVWPNGIDSLRHVVRLAERNGRSLSIAGGRHAMGAQQFGSETVLVDTTHFNRILELDAEAGIVEVESGIQWPELIGGLVGTQEDSAPAWTIAQKQTGTDRLTIGGALAANAHGRGLNMRPIIGDVDSFTLLNHTGNIVHCDRHDNAELFRLAIGGYGLFGVVANVRLRLTRRRKLERVVEVIDIDGLIPAFEERRREGFLYGDCQYAIDETSPDYIKKGVFSCYRPVAPDTPMPENRRRLSPHDWEELILLAHTDKTAAFDRYVEHYLKTSGQIYWSDLHQLSTYLDDYHTCIDRKMKSDDAATEVISEVYVPRERLTDFLEEVREDFRRNRVNLIYGTIRLIERDDESYLAWAKQSYVCIIFNLHTIHTSEGIEHSAGAFRRLIDMASRRDGTYFLTYHKFATREQVETCYPQIVDFLKLKLKYDPEERFYSDWYHHYRRMFADVL